MHRQVEGNGEAGVAGETRVAPVTFFLLLFRFSVFYVVVLSSVTKWIIIKKGPEESSCQFIWI